MDSPLLGDWLVCVNDLGDLPVFLEQWETDGAESDFPYQAVLACYRETGKHFVSESVLAALGAIRATLPDNPRSTADRRQLDAFLTVALDKWDSAHTYPTYIGLGLLGLTPDADGRTGRRERDEWLRLLLADMYAFEHGALARTHDWLPRARPDDALVAKRSHLLVTALSNVLGRDLGASPGAESDATAELLASASAARRRALDLSMQPVYVLHDEHLFLRVLQSFEVTFAAMAAEIRDAVGAVRAGRADRAAAAVGCCADTLSSARPLFSLLATMRVESFREFRAYTVGASAIQSGNYKTFEALCGAPAPARLSSPAFDAVPQVRDRIRRDLDDLTSAVVDAVGRGVLDAAGLARVYAAVAELERVHQRWKQTHWKLAARMIGEEVGTGYTVGVPYLRSVIDNRLFARLSEFTGVVHA